MVVVGGGNSAVEEVIGLLRFADSVTLLVRGDHLKASKVAVDNIMSEERITIHFNTTVTRLGGDNKLAEVYVKNTVTGAEDIPTPDGLFVFIGQPAQHCIFAGERYSAGQLRLYSRRRLSPAARWPTLPG